jgi:hypothetical protein
VISGALSVLVLDRWPPILSRGYPGLQTRGEWAGTCVHIPPVLHVATVRPNRFARLTLFRTFAIHTTTRHHSIHIGLAAMLS